MTHTPSSSDLQDTDTRDWAVSAVTAFLHRDSDAQDLLMRDCPVMGPEALATMCSAMLEVLAECEGISPEQALQAFALRLQRST